MDAPASQDVIGLSAGPRRRGWKQALDELSVIGMARNEAGVPMPRTRDAHAARRKMEFIGLVQARHWSASKC